MKKTLFAVLALVIVATLAFTACGGTSTEGGEQGGEELAAVKVGVIMDLTGANSEWGVAQAWGIQHAADEINAAGGINGHQIEVTTLDCASDAQTAVTAYRQLVDEYEVNVILAPAISSNVIPMAPLADEDQVCVVGHFQDDRCTANEETGETYSYMFLTQPSSSQQAQMLADYAYNKLNCRTFGALYDQGNAFAMSLYTPFEAKVAELEGAQMIASESFQSTDADYRAQATKIAKANPECVFLPNYAATSALAYDQLREAGYTGIIIGANTLQQPFGSLTTTEITNIYLLQNYDHYSAKKNTTVVDAYKEYAGMDYYIANAEFGYDDMLVVADAMKKMDDPTDTASLNKYLEQVTDCQLNSMKITINPETHRPSSLPLQIATYNDQKQLEIVDTYNLVG